jgi:hypothetical protein
LSARTVRGIEHVVAAEITDRNFGEVETVRHREVWFRGYPDAVRLRTADDLIRVVAVVDDVTHTRAALTTLADAAASVLLPDKEVDVTASFLGRRNYNRYDIEDAVGKALMARYHPRRSGLHRPRCGATVHCTNVTTGRYPGPAPRIHRWRRRCADSPGTCARCWIRAAAWAPSRTRPALLVCRLSWAATWSRRPGVWWRTRAGCRCGTGVWPRSSPIRRGVDRCRRPG